MLQLYAALGLLEVLGLIVLCSLSIWYADEHPNDDVQHSNSIQYTSIVSLVASVAFLYFVVDSILLENVFQLWIALLLHSLITAYVVWHYLGNGDDLGELYDHFSLAVMIAVAVFQLAYMMLQFPVQGKFGWRLYKRVGGNVAIRPLYRTATVFFSLLKLDFTMGVLGVLLAIFYLIDSSAQLILNIFACIVTLLWMVLGFWFVMAESRRLGVLFFLFATLEPTFLVYKLVEMKRNQDAAAASNDQADYPVFSWRELLLTASIAVVVRMATIVYGVKAWRNFGMGLQEKIWNPPTPHAHVATLQPSAQHAQEDYFVHAVVVVQAEPQQDRSALRSYIQPLL